jgi:hypothetical protein
LTDADLEKMVGQPHVTALAPNPLAQRDIAAMIDRVAGNKRLQANIRHEILERTDGIAAAKIYSEICF